MTNPSSQNEPPVLQTHVTGPGLYAFLSNAVYKLDQRTYQLVWKHTFASDEAVQGDPRWSIAPGQVLGARDILYMGTHEKHLCVLNTADGSVLWRQWSARDLANSTAAYTLVESKTAQCSTLTAYDEFTGKTLWQRQYPIVGSKIDSAFHSDGFRLITVTDQLLYAVVGYSQNGQGYFARYGLSPADGSILWQNHEAVAGPILNVEAHIVDGVIYTIEYGVKSVPPTLDSYGMTMTHLTEVRAVAYNLATGQQRWQTPSLIGEQPNGASFSTISKSILYFQTFHERAPLPSTTTLHALSLSDGTLRWQYEQKGGNLVGAALQGESIYVETSRLEHVGAEQDFRIHVVALNALTGEVRWSTPVKLLDGSERWQTREQQDHFGVVRVDMPPVVCAETVYYSTPENRIYAIQSSDGKILAQFWVEKTAQTTVSSRVVLFVGP